MHCAAAACDDIEAVQIVQGDYAQHRPLITACENLAKVFEGEFMTYPGRGGLSNGPCAEPVAFVENPTSHVRVLILRNISLKQVR